MSVYFFSSGEENVGKYKATFYSINGISLETRKRREHLSADDVKRNKAMLDSFSKGNLDGERAV